MVSHPEVVHIRMRIGIDKSDSEWDSRKNCSRDESGSGPI
jgi:hypothetical protein